MYSKYYIEIQSQYKLYVYVYLYINMLYVFKSRIACARESENVVFSNAL